MFFLATGWVCMKTCVGMHLVCYYPYHFCLCTLLSYPLHYVMQCFKLLKFIACIALCQSYKVLLEAIVINSTFNRKICTQENTSQLGDERFARIILKKEQVLQK